MIKTIRSILLLICIGCTLVGCDEESSFVTEENLSSYITEQATEKEDNAELHQYGMELENVGKMQPPLGRIPPWKSTILMWDKGIRF